MIVKKLAIKPMSPSNAQQLRRTFPSPKMALNPSNSGVAETPM